MKAHFNREKVHKWAQLVIAAIDQKRATDINVAVDTLVAKRQKFCGSFFGALFNAKPYSHSQALELLKTDNEWYNTYDRINNRYAEPYQMAINIGLACEHTADADIRLTSDEICTLNSWVNADKI